MSSSATFSSQASSKVPDPSSSHNAITRVEWIDIAKGIGIMLVSFGHIRNGSGQSVWLPALNVAIEDIYLFHMPLFFFLGGLTFSARKPFKSFLVHKAATLLLPYYIFSLYFLAKPIVTMLMPSLNQSLQTNKDYAQDLGSQFYGVFINGSGLWFLWAYFIGELITYWLSKTLKARWQYACSGIFLIALSLWFEAAFPHITLPFQLIRGLEVAGFILLGTMCRQWLMALRRDKAWFGFIGASCLFLGCTVFNPYIAYYPLRILLPIGAMFLGIAAGTFLSIGIAHCRLLSHIGRYSLSFYVVNALTMNIGKILFFRVLNIDGPSSSVLMQWVYGLLLLTFCTALLWLEDRLIRRFIPWSLGIFTKPVIADTI